MGKIVTLPELEQIAAHLHRTGKRIVTTNGVFDILHAGHVDYLKKARSLGDVLIVGVNTDESVRTYKDSRRPIVPLQDRLEVLAELACVDFAFSFSDADPCGWISRIKPYIHVKGGDYKLPLLEQNAVESCGGTVHIIPITKGLSTTDIIKTILERYGTPR